MLLSTRLLLVQLVALAGVSNSSKLSQTVDGERRNVVFSSRRLDEGYCRPECGAPTPGPVEEIATPAPITPRPTRNPTPNPTPVPTPEPTPQPVDNTAECPFFVLDFADLVAGTYVYDDFMYTHGVKITAIRKGTSWGYTPINGNHVNSGGGAMVFDTKYPTGNDGQALCSGSDGDDDLGSPNESCPGGGPGVGPGGAPTRVVNGNTVPNPYANCEAQGKVLVIQEEDKSCPDDTRAGGYINFEFNEPTEVDFATLLDVDEGNTPDFHITYGNGSRQTLSNTPGTGDNGILKNPLEKANVKKVSIEYHGSGSISELRYRFCPPTDITPNFIRRVIDFEDNQWGGFTRSGSSSQQCGIINDSRCSGEKSVRCPATNTDVSMQINAPDGAYQMNYKFSIPNNMENTDKVHVLVGGSVVKEYENYSNILTAGLSCFDGSVFVQPGQQVKFLIRTSTTSEFFDLHEVEFLIDQSPPVSADNNFEDGGMGVWTTSGSGSNGWRVLNGAQCVGTRGVKAGPHTSSEVYMSATVPPGMNRMSFKHSIPSGVFETNDKLWVSCGGVTVRMFEEDSGIRSNGVNCRVETVNVTPGQQVKFTAKTSYSNEYWEIDEIVFWQA